MSAAVDTKFAVVTPNSILGTDGYKFSMAMAGWPLRMERFYLTFRRGGIHYVPFDLKEYVESLLPPQKPSDDDLRFLDQNNYTMSPAMLHAIRNAVEIEAVPKGAWFFDQEPILSVYGPSFLVSWLEAQLTWINYPIQLATHLLLFPDDESPIEVVSEEHETVVRRVLEELGVEREIKRNEYFGDLMVGRARTIVDALGGEGDVDLRIIEGGMRSAVSMDHHRMVLEACKEVGITRTSNVQIAKELSMIPTGTAGHEHSQRCGSDLFAYRTGMNRLPGLVGCLLDTWDTLALGIPAAMQVAHENPSRQFLGRLDSGDREGYFHLLVNRLKETAITNMVINVAGDVDAEKIRSFEPLRKLVDWHPNKLSYMIGGKLTSLPTKFTRSRVAAVYKLCWSDGPVMKLGDETVGFGKRSIPGHPIIFRRFGGTKSAYPISIIGQAGEDNPDPDHYVRLDQIKGSGRFGVESELIRTNYPQQISYRQGTSPATFSEATQQLINQCIQEAQNNAGH